MKEKLTYLKKQTATFENPQFMRSSTVKSGTQKVERNTQGYYDKKGWILKKATSTYMGMSNW